MPDPTLILRRANVSKGSHWQYDDFDVFEWRSAPRRRRGPSVSETREAAQAVRISSLSDRAPSQYRYVARSNSNELDVRTALKHATDQGKVAARGPQTGPRGHVSVPIERIDQSAEVFDYNIRRWACPFNPAAHASSLDPEQCSGVRLRQPS
jgi:hypothetical protein